MAESTSKSLSDLVRALASATGWVQHVVELNTALQPFLANGLDLDSIEADIESARQRHAGIAVQIRAAEDQLASVNERITLADDARRLQIDADLNAYAASVDSRKRALDTELAALRDKLSAIVESITTKSEVAVAIDAQIADQRRTLDQLKSDAAGVVSKLTAIAGGASN